MVTPLKTNMSPEDYWLEDVFPIELVPFWGHVSFQGCICCIQGAGIGVFILDSHDCTDVIILTKLVEWKVNRP